MSGDAPEPEGSSGEDGRPTGAEALVKTLVGSGVQVCFANPGTSEMHFVAALDRVGGMRPVLGLFEGVVTGAADGYARISGKPACTLLHLGPGLGNGIANLHNARRAHSPVVNVVGDHATYHKRLDAPLESDIDSLAGPVSKWVSRAWRPQDVGPCAAAAVAAARGGDPGVATLILPADVSWSGGGLEAAPVSPESPLPPRGVDLESALGALRSGAQVTILIGGSVAADPEAQKTVWKLARATGARLLCETFPARFARGRGLPPIGRLAYLAEMATKQLSGSAHLILIGTRMPVPFFAYPGMRDSFIDSGCQVHSLAPPGTDAAVALEALADGLGTDEVQSWEDPDPPASARTGEDTLGLSQIFSTLARLLPEDSIVVDEGNTSSVGMGGALAAAPPHDLLTLTGGAIGYGLPSAVGAAVAGEGRPVLSLQADGSAMYTISALWTMARESLDVTTVIFNNRSYAILNMELSRTGTAGAGPLGSSLLDLSGPDLDFVAMAASMGVPGERVSSSDDMEKATRRAFSEPGPHLIEALI